jgi:hypothetical protein
MKKTGIPVALAASLLASCAMGPSPASKSDLLVCGGDEVALLDVRGEPKTLWTWRAADRPEIPETLRSKFGSTDDCKPIDGGRKILVTSSGGAVAIVERGTGRAVFSAAVVNAHSAELLPGNRVVAASSTGTGGNKLLLFDATSGKLLASDDLLGAHGVVWDPDRGVLWALGHTEFRSYDVTVDRPTGSLLLARRLTRELPNPDGHDLRAVPGTPDLAITTGNHVWLFHRDLLTFRLHPALGDAAGVKSVDVDPDGGATAYVKAETSWWAEHVRFLGPSRTIDFPGKKVYKARWSPRPD